MLRRRFAAAITAIALGLIGAVAAPAAAHADDYCDYEDSTFPTISSYSPSTVTVGLQSKLVTFNVKANDECGIDSWDIYGPHVWAWDSNPTERIDPWTNADAGSSYVDIEVHDPAYNVTTKRLPFRLKRATYVSGFNATPEPVKKGKYLTIKGTLKRADWDRNAYVKYGARSQKVQIQFRTKNASTYSTIKTVTLNKSSAVSTKIKVSGKVARDGFYRLHYAGNGVSGTTTTKGDYVDVR